MKIEPPKVLIISEFFFSENSGGGILLKNLFQDYPKEKIFILHEDVNVPSDSSIKSYLLKKPSKTNTYLKKKLHPFFINQLINLKNFYGINRKKKVDSDLLTKLQQFKPDVIYTIFGDYSLMCLIKELKLKLGIPLVTHVMDNVLATYTNKKKEYNLFKYLIDASVKRIAINFKMSVEYKKIFGYKFEVLHNGIDRKKIKKVSSKKKLKTVTYIGSVFKNAQLNSLVAISEVIKKLIDDDHKIKCLIYLPENQKIIYESFFPKHQDIKIKIHNLDENEYFKKISESNLLLLASNFDKDSIDYYKYSWPAKMASYLMSNVPIFIYGPNNIFFINDARKTKWAYVENRNSVLNLEKSMKNILYDSNLRKEVLRYAKKKSSDFELDKIQNKIQKILGSSQK